MTSTIRALATEVRVGPRNNLDHGCVVDCDSIGDDPGGAPAGPVAALLPDQEEDLARAIRAAFDLD
jgi:mRNA interferase MazF